MKTRVLGKDLTVSAVSLGCMGFTHAYGTAMDEKEAARVIAQAVELGYLYFDTAECYIGDEDLLVLALLMAIIYDGSTAYNEDLVGEALKPYRKDVVIASKFGVRHTPEGLAMDARPEVIRQSVEGSLKRLQTDYIDLYYQHRIDPKVEPEVVAQMMSDLIQEGKIEAQIISPQAGICLRAYYCCQPLSRY